MRTKEETGEELTREFVFAPAAWACVCMRMYVYVFILYLRMGRGGREGGRN